MTRAVLGLVTLVAIAGCHGAIVLSDGNELTCSGNASAAGLTGSWIVSGSGSRSGCSDSRYEGAFTLGPSQPIAVAVVAADAGANVSNIALATTISSFSLTGTAQSSCINFTTNETANGQTTNYSFSGILQGTNVVSGTLSGTGPGTCVVAGSFSVSAK